MLYYIARWYVVILIVVVIVIVVDDDGSDLLLLCYRSFRLARVSSLTTLHRCYIIPGRPTMGGGGGYTGGPKPYFLATLSPRRGASKQGTRYAIHRDF